MKLRSLGGGAGIALIVLGCGGDVGIGKGAAGGSGGRGGAQSGGSSGSLNAAGSGAAGTGAGGGDAGSPGVGGTPATGVGGQGTPGGGTTGYGGWGGEPPQLSSDKLDLLFVVDNSISMGEHQNLLAASVGTFLRRLENPLCLEANGTPSVTQPAGPEMPCPSGSREFTPVRDMHVGVITTSLGARGGQICTDAAGDDKAQLLPSVRAGLPSYQEQGFLKWDPAGTATPPGESDIDAIAADLTEAIAAANTNGCGYEHTLEAWYQFLIDPEPTTNISVVNNVSMPQDVNATVLEQRAAFLRPDSAVAIIVLTNENDCSIRGDSMGWLIGLSQSGGRAFTMPRATAACAANPNDPCCRSCATSEAAPPNGCTPLDVDPQCLINGGNLDNSATANEDQLNLRCYDQKRRFGFDLLYPIERYVSALRSEVVPNRLGDFVPNPLFSPARNSSLISFALIAGVPWQDISVDPPGEELSYLSAAELEAENRWGLILGDPRANVPPQDPLLLETPNERSGISPLIGAALVPSSSQDPTANPGNGHEQTNIDNADLQFSCTFELPTPISCVDPSCDCGPGSEARNRSICQPPSGGPVGNTQYYGKAYPPLRHLAVARALGDRSVLGSICPRNALDDTRSDYAFSAEFNSLARRLGVMLID